MSLKVTILGCGNSLGTPSIGNHWGHCDPNEPRNRRTRASIAIQSAETTLVVDTGPDFKEQINSNNIKAIDGVLYSHAHSDHIHGIDELRAFRLRENKITNIYGNSGTIDELKDRFSYMFVSMHTVYPQVLEAHIIEESQYDNEMHIGDISFIPYDQDHGTCRSLGYRFGDFAYSTDMYDLPEQSVETLRGIKTWLVDSCGYKFPNVRVHANLKRLYGLNEIIQAEHVILTHLSSQMDYRKVEKELPDGYSCAYDNMEIEALASTKAQEIKKNTA